MKDLRYDSKDLGFEEKLGFAIWLNGLNTVTGKTTDYTLRSDVRFADH